MDKKLLNNLFQQNNSEPKNTTDALGSERTHSSKLLSSNDKNQ